MHRICITQASQLNQSWIDIKSELNESMITQNENQGQIQVDIPTASKNGNPGVVNQPLIFDVEETNELENQKTEWTTDQINQT